MTNKLKTLVLFSLLTGLFLAIGGALGGREGLFIAFIMAMVMNFFSYWCSDSIVLKMYRAQELSESDAPALHKIIAELAYNAGLPKPRLYIVPDDSPNAFATGRNPEHAVIAVTQGILKLLDTNELRGVLAHEMSHIANRDILIQSCAAVLGTAITYLANMLYYASLFGGGSRNDDNRGGIGGALGGVAMMILAPLAATLIRMAISRSREFLADETGARISGSPLSLASALTKLEAYSRRLPLRNANPSTEGMFIVTPLTGGGIQNLFRTHPTTEERVERLKAIAAGAH